MTRQVASPRKVLAAERQAKAIALRKAGVTFPEIATALGYANEAGARKAVMTVMRNWAREQAEDRSDVLAIELERLDDLLRGVWGAATAGHLGAVDRVLKISQRRAQLLGLDAPVKVAPTDPDGKELPSGVVLYLPAGPRLRDNVPAPGEGAASEA